MIHANMLLMYYFTKCLNVMRYVFQDVAQIETDAYVVVYSVADRKSFEKAVDIMYDLRKCLITQRAIILVANKTDIVRTRQVTHEGKMPLSLV